MSEREGPSLAERAWDEAVGRELRAGRLAARTVAEAKRDRLAELEAEEAAETSVPFETRQRAEALADALCTLDSVAQAQEATGADVSAWTGCMQTLAVMTADPDFPARFEAAMRHELSALGALEEEQE